MARPWVTWTLSALKYPAARPLQPIPETTVISSAASAISARAKVVCLKMVPMAHPGHQVVGIFSQLM
jgi:hypothetical protein